MVVSIRELVNTLHSTISKPQNNLLKLSEQYLMDIETDFSRECSVSLSFNSFREVFVISAGSSIDYTECIQAQANKITQAEQVKSRKVQNSSLFYVLLKKTTLDTVSMRPIVELMHIFYIVEINCKNASQSLEPLVILYQANQSVDL